MSNAGISMQLRFVDVQHPRTPGGTPPKHLMVDCNPGERVVSVETVKDSFGYASARVWLEADRV